MNREIIRILMRQLDQIKSELLLQISSTPSGQRRNELADANTHIGKALNLLMQGQEELRRVAEEIKKVNKAMKEIDANTNRG